MGTNCVDPVAFDGFFACDYHVGGISFESLGQGAIACIMSTQKLADNNIITKSIFRGHTTATASARRRNEVFHDRIKCASRDTCNRAKSEQIHKLATTQIWDIGRT